jgi:hypothetical protein
LSIRRTEEALYNIFPFNAIRRVITKSKTGPIWAGHTIPVPTYRQSIQNILEPETSLYAIATNIVAQLNELSVTVIQCMHLFFGWTGITETHLTDINTAFPRFCNVVL